MNKENSLKRFLNDKNAKDHFPAEGEATISGVIVEGDEKTGLAKNITQIMLGKKSKIDLWLDTLIGQE